MPREFGIGDNESTMSRFVPRQMAPRTAERHRRIAIPRAPLAVGNDLSVAVVLPSALPSWHEFGPSTELCAQIGGEIAYLKLPVPLLQRLLARAEARLPPDRVDAELAAMLLEAAFSEQVQGLETVLDRDVALLRVEAPSSRDDLADLGLRIEFGEGEAFPAVLRASAALLSRLLSHWEAQPPAQEMGVAPRFRIASRVAFIDLSVAALRLLGVGDAMLFDRVAVAGGAAIALGERLFAPGSFDESGALFLSEPFSRSANLHFGDFAMDDADRNGDSSAISDVEIENLPVRLVFEIGRMDLTLDELRNLSVGTPLPLPRALTSAVDIFANGSRIGAGEMVMIGEQLGVRVTRLSGDA